MFFFLWGYLKSRVHFNTPNNLEDFRELALKRNKSALTLLSAVYKVSTLVSVPNGWRGAISTFTLNFIVNLKCLFLLEVNYILH
jgi:hypothetical protein